MTAPLALLHGFTSGPESFRPLIEALGDGNVAVAPTLVGHGAPEGDAAVTGFESEVDRIARLLDAQGPRFHVVGYSLGGRVALGLLVRYPGLFAQATLIGAQPGLETEVERAERRLADERWCGLLLSQGIEAFVDEWERVPLFESQSSLPASVRLAQRVERLKRRPEGLVRSLRLTGLGVMPSYWDALARIPVPTRLVVGALDPKLTEIARRMSAEWPDVTVRIVPGAGHNVVLEQPAALSRILEERRP